MKKTNKISVIGAGFVGSATVFALMDSGLASEIVLVDINREKAKGEILDLAHGAAFVKPVNLVEGDVEATKDSDLIIITAGANQRTGETRLDLVKRNVEIFKNLVPPLAEKSPNAILLVVANPVDILTYITYKLSGFPKNRVIGSGTVLDSSRLRYALSEEFDIDARNVHAYIIGEHGDTEFPVWSSAHIGNMSISEYYRREKLDTHELEERIHDKVRNAAYEIIQAKGYTNYAIALSVKRIAAAILRDENSILTVSTLDEKEQVYYSKPYIVGRKGPILDVCPPLSTEEVEKLKHSKNVLKKIIEETGI